MFPCLSILCKSRFGSSRFRTGVIRSRACGGGGSTSRPPTRAARNRSSVLPPPPPQRSVELCVAGPPFPPIVLGEPARVTAATRVPSDPALLRSARLAPPLQLPPEQPSAKTAAQPVRQLPTPDGQRAASHSASPAQQQGLG